MGGVGLQTQVSDLESKVSELTEKLDSSESMAALGVEARNQLITAALASGVRSGKVTPENEESTRTLLDSLDLDSIRERQSFWDEVAATRFPGGRHTSDGSDDSEAGSDEGSARVHRVSELYSFGIR